MDDLLAAKSAERRFALIVFQIFALAALTLAAGIYGVLATSVAERSREIGVRSVLGATRSMIVTLVLRQGLTLVALGVAIGLLGAAALSRSIVALLFLVSPLDPVTYLGMVSVLGAVAVSGLRRAGAACGAARSVDNAEGRVTVLTVTVAALVLEAHP
jgi:putative ABC transport system permease protein